ncbi:hypothetical protein N7540_006650 [Penicillium herquei]|nr:hypothetical protein N7540_006650 [Penicillium herquei]
MSKLAFVKDSHVQSMIPRRRRSADVRVLYHGITMANNDEKLQQFTPRSRKRIRSRQEGKTCSDVGTEPRD